MKIQKKGFSLAEMMVVMLVLTVVLAASTPIITKRATQKIATSSTGNSGTYFANCPTGGATADKMATTSDASFTLKTGSTVLVTFTNANTAPATTLNINSTGKCPIASIDGVVTEATHPVSINATQTIMFVYDGANWRANQKTRYDSGWFLVTGVNPYVYYTKTHGLGTSNIEYSILLADDANGTNTRTPAPFFEEGTSRYGWFSQSITNSNIVVGVATYVGAHGEASGYYRIIAEKI